MSSITHPHTIVHVTHEAVEKIGGIGTVLEGMITSPVYREAVGRTILIGPMGGHHFESPMRRLGSQVSVRYSSKDGIDTQMWGRRFRPLERAFQTPIAYGTRHYELDDGSGRVGEAEIVLFDLSNPNKMLLNEFKTRLWKEFEIDAARFETDWGFEEYCRLAEPAFYAAAALLDDEELPAVLISHEFMGMCTALKAVLDGKQFFRTVFHAHECSTARRITEHHPGHDTAFYNIMRQASEQGQFVTDVFGDQTSIMRHELISRAHHLDASLAVGDPTAEELHFLSPKMKASTVHLVYNGVPSLTVNHEVKATSRQRMDRWVERVTGRQAQYIMTHVTRPVISKGLWRDLKVASYLDPLLEGAGMTGLLIILTCGAPPRSYQTVQKMAREYGWPFNHRPGYPDLVGMEQDLYDVIKPFNAGHRAIQVVLVNQFGWTRQTLGDAADEEMTFGDLRIAADVEFGQSVYEPFGIAPLEPLAAGAICVPSSVCGCAYSYEHAARQLGLTPEDLPNVLIADYTQLEGDFTIPQLLDMTRDQRDVIEEHVAENVARTLFERLPRTDAQRTSLIETGQQISEAMGWDAVLRDSLLPIFDDLIARPHHTPHVDVIEQLSSGVG
ncbi:MAG: hypothetical protein D8M59_07960 [Planctomycetes bacterium]|nr:hypothetical protein [Planctomycetota bacterium]NOG53257.1 hypothetical protein [Planctomycetota bacterium]